MKNHHKSFQNFLIIIVTIWLVLFSFLPNLIIIFTSFLTKNNSSLIEGAFTLENYKRLLNPLYIKVIFHSLKMAITATIVCLLISYPFAFILTKLPKKIQPLMVFFLILPFWTNSLMRIHGLKIFLSAHGYLNNFLIWCGIINKPFHIIYTQTAVIIGLIYILLPFMIMPLYSSFLKLDKFYFEAAEDLGANKFQVFLYIVIPLTLSGIISGCLLVLLTAMSLFYISDLLGGAKNLLIGNVIKNQFLNLGDFPFGSATSIVLTLVMGLLLCIYYYIIRLLHKRKNIQNDEIFFSK